MNTTVDKIIMFNMAVSDMDKAKAFYADRLGLKVTKDYGKGNMRWVTLELPGGGTGITLTTNYVNLKLGTMYIYFSTSDVQAAYQQMNIKDTQATSPIGNDLYGPGSGVKWFQIEDPDGNHLIIAQ